MAHMPQEKKKDISSKLKPILKKYNLSGSLSVHHHSCLILTISRGPIDFIESYNRIGKLRNPNIYSHPDYKPEDHISVNEYYYKEHFDGEALAALSEIIPILNEGNFNDSDSQTDYFSVGWYLEINIGRWNKPYQLEISAEAQPEKKPELSDEDQEMMIESWMRKNY